MAYKILCTDGILREGFAELESSHLFDVDFCETLSHDELLKKIDRYDGIVVRSASKVLRDVIEAGKNLKLIARAGIGTDNIDIDAATKKGIFVINAPSGNTISTAELTFAMILALSRNLPQAALSMSKGKWDRKRYKGAEVAFKTLGIIGLGRVGREVATRAQAFRMKVVGYDPAITDDQLASLGVTPLLLKEILRTADFITVHTPLTPETKNMITLREMKTMKPTARIINCARGGIVNEKDLAKALKEEKIAGAALDVFSSEPFDPSIFEGVENCIMTPHLGASTSEAQDAVASEIAASVSRFFAEGVMAGAVNLPSSGEATWNEYRQHIALAEKLGSLAFQLLGGKFGKMTFFSTTTCPALLSIAALEGSLSLDAVERVTFVNVMRVAKERKIAVMEKIVDASQDYDGSIGVRLSSGDKAVEVWGTVFDDGTQKITRCDDYRVEIDPAGSLLFVQNLDRPGMIGRICSILGEGGINIAEMQNVRKKVGDVALTIVGIDGSVSNEALARIGSEDGISEVRLVSL